MLDLTYLEQHPQEAIRRLATRSDADFSTAVHSLITLNTKRKETQQRADTLAAQLNAHAKEIGRYLAQKDERRIAPLKAEIATLKTTHKRLAEELTRYETELHDLLLTLPNLPDARVAEGRHAEDNEVLHTWDGPHGYSEAKKPHWELLEDYGIASFPLGTKITGAGFPVYTGKGARLQRALIAFFLDQATARGYQEVLPPLLVNQASAEGTGQLPDKEGMMYGLSNAPLYLIPTAEVPVTNLYRDTILEKAALPFKHVAYSACFRREAGSWGSDVRGLNRLHQFDKVELVEIHHPDQADDALEAMKAYVQHLVERLGLRYRTLRLCSGDLGQTSAITYDIEVWSPAQKRWLEVSSISSFKDYQARRMRLKYRDKKEKGFCHTLNGSALALPRILAALLETYQTQEGIAIPEVLHHYTAFTHITKP